MSEANSESKFGFKDKEKAEETLQLLENHEMQYRRLTVRGLLGRAKRVLSMTKAEEKVKNINEAIEVFENWLAENGGGVTKASKTEDNNNDDKVETVPGLGFKDKEAAEKTIKVLEGRDPEYQRLAVKSLITSSKRVLSGTKNEEKIKSIHEGVKILEEFLEKFETDNMIRYQKPYLAYSIIEQLLPPSPSPENSLVVEFLAAYGGSKAKGNYKHLRTMYPSSDDTTSWDIIRNKNLKQLADQLKSEELKLFDSETGKPTEIHMNMIYWAYSPQPEKLKLYIEKLSNNLKRNISDSGDGDDEEETTPKKKIKSDE